MPYAIQQNIPEDDCAICTDSLKDPTKAVYQLSCGHFYHNDCLNDYCGHDYPNTLCPLCRAPFDPEDCNTFWAFKEGALQFDNLPAEVQAIYLTLHPEHEHQGGRRKSKSKLKSKSKRRPYKYMKRRKTIKYKRFRARPFLM